jgi:branched-chain amino acid transport system permease protein
VIQSILDAVSLGGVYALAALGLGLVFGVMRLVNFAHAELITIAAYVFVQTHQLPLILSVALAAASSAILALLMELLAYRRLRGSSPATMLIVSFGVSVLLQKVYELIFGALPKSAEIAPWMTGAFTAAGISITISSVVTIALTIVILLAMGFLVERTTLGLQLRAAASDFQTARLLGVRANRLIASAFALSGMLAAVVGFVTVVENPQVDPRFGLDITILALVGVVIGGMHSLRGSALGGFIVGAALSLLNSILGNARVYAYSWMFLLVLVILIVRPGGLLSKNASKERV